MVRSPIRDKIGAMIKLGPFAVTRDGALSLPDEAPAASIRFAWKGRPCEARLEAGRLRLTAIAGCIPSTAEPGADRSHTFAALARLPPEMPPGWRLRLMPDHRLCVETEGSPQLSAAPLVAAMVRFALALDPYLGRFDAAGAGRVRT